MTPLLVIVPKCQIVDLIILKIRAQIKKNEQNSGCY
jgi:hypothetical protein